VNARVNARRATGDFWTGLAAPWRGLAFLARRPPTWPLAIVPAFVACALFVLFAWLFIHASLRWVAALFPHAAGFRADPFTSVLRWLLDLFAIVLSLAVAVWPSLTLASPVSATPLERLVRLRDRDAGAAPYPPSPWTTSVLRALGAALVGIAVGVPTSLLLIAGHFLVPAAIPVLAPLGALVSSYVVAWNLLDYPLGLRAMTLPDRARWMRDHAALATGFAVSTSLFLYVPGVGLLLLPAGVVGAAIVVEHAETRLAG
jgi:CysZ protein